VTSNKSSKDSSTPTPLRLHPVMTRGFRISTPPIRSAFDNISHVVASTDPGCAYVGPPRFGKSNLAEYCQAMLPKAYPDVPIFLFNGDHDRKRSRNGFYEAIYAETLSPAKLPRRSTDFRRLLTHLWWLRARNQNSHQIVFIGDEMQYLTMDEYSWLIVTSNDLQRLGVRLTSILFAQPELLHIRTSFHLANRGDILGRFMPRIYAFRGLNSAIELRDVMTAYDDALEFEYPESSGICFTEFFLPKAYKAGWRLSSCANECWNQFQLIARDELGKLKESKELESSAKAERLTLVRAERLTLGMEWVAGAIKNILSRSSDYDQPGFRIKPDEWRRAIKRTTFAESLATTYELGGGVSTL
jgi:hypothetical protein